MEQLTRISSPASEAWVAWVMLLLIMILLLIEKSQRRLLLNSVKSIFTVKERESMFSELSSGILTEVFVHVYRILVIAMTIYLISYIGGTFSLLVFAELAMCVALVAVFKYVVARLLAYVYFDQRRLQVAVRQYSELLSIFTVLAIIPLMFSVTVFALNTTWVIIWAGALYLLFLICITIKLFRLFFNKKFACFYILLYLCTLELLPVGILLNVAWVIAS